MFKKEITYGYSVETILDSKARIVKPLNLKKINLTPINSKFIFHSTRNDILKWMSSHSELLVEYNPFAANEPEFTLPPSSLLSAYPEIPEIIPCPPTSTTSSSSTSSYSISSTGSTSSTSKKPHDITFDLFATPTKALALMSEDSTVCKQLSAAWKFIPWLEVILEIRPTNEYQDSKLYPIQRVVLPSGSSLSEVIKALEKGWKNHLLDADFLGGESIFSRKKSKSDLTISDEENKSHNKSPKEKHHTFMAEVAKHVPVVESWLRQKETSGEIPPGVLNPYIVDDVLESLDDKKEFENFSLSKEEEAELDKESYTDDLPQYGSINNDVLLARGSGQSV